MSNAKRKTKIDPFRVRTTKTDTKVNEIVTPPDDIAEAIDNYFKAKEQAKHFEGEATIYKEPVSAFCRAEFARRAKNGIADSFKLQGHETYVTYITTKSSSGLTESDTQNFADRFGKKAADALIARDYSSVKFNTDVLEANFEAVVSALQVLPEHVLGSLFKPMLMKAKPDAVEKAKAYAKDVGEYEEMVSMLRIKNYIR